MIGEQLLLSQLVNTRQGETPIKPKPNLKQRGCTYQKVFSKIFYSVTAPLAVFQQGTGAKRRMMIINMTDVHVSILNKTIFASI